MAQVVEDDPARVAMKIAGLILAAGASRRMGEPKALLELGGETFLDRLIRVFSTRCDPVVVVLGHEAQRIRAGIRRGAEFVVNPDPDMGQLSSMQCGLMAVPDECEAVLFTPVDYPSVKESTVATVTGAFRGGIVVPVCKGRRGHPVCVSRDAMEELQALGEGATARDVIHRWRDRTSYVEVDDPGILHDIDDREAYQQLIGE